MLTVYNDVLTADQNINLYETLLYYTPFMYGEIDTNDTPPNGMIHNLQPDSVLFKTFYDAVVRTKFELKNLKIERAYVNLFSPNEQTYFHVDGNVITCLFYITPEYDINEGGETQFIIDDKIIGIQSKPSRLVMFDGNILHRATSFRSNPRITVALKFIP